jgi:RNA polymerase sigma-70 factor (ECF subfamily)
MPAESVAPVVEGRAEGQALDFGEIVRLHQRRIFFLALDLTGNHHDAEDLAQEAFLKAYQGLKRFRGDAALGTWLYRITVNTYIDRCRTRSEAMAQTQRSWDDDQDSIPAPPDDNPMRNPERRTESMAIQRHIDLALERLSPQQRAIFVLRHYQELKLREIASVLDLSEGTVKKTLFRAVRRLQHELSCYRPELGLEERS